jgi:hypothetical protein
MNSSRTAERPIRQDLDVVREAVVDDAVEKVVVVPDAHFDLHGRNLGDASRLLDLSNVHVAETDARNEALLLESSQRSYAGREWHARIRCVQLIQVDARHAEGGQTRFTRVPQVTTSAIR